ncbi:GNAT family N-acetyltransferase [Brevibacillus daliensis]|uniref:GNAT family N-acetyltransferase n=1 Tax=Brevibacillus daliensis TaxID=2892995 RepID=UPI001E304388|nr:GNAT family N-acetyltransferase [Brevibacillus daliensis]
MTIRLERVSFEEQPILHNIMQYYVYEFSKYVKSIKLNDNGMYEPFNLTMYWESSNHHPFFIKVDDELAGFVLVKSKTYTEPSTIEEFFVMRKFKGKGIGKVAAMKIFDMFTGRWKITQIQKNYPAQAFWRGVISEYTNGKYYEEYDEHRRSVQEFDTNGLMK